MDACAETRFDDDGLEVTGRVGELVGVVAGRGGVRYCDGEVRFERREVLIGEVREVGGELGEHDGCDLRRGVFGWDCTGWVRGAARGG